MTRFTTYCLRILFLVILSGNLSYAQTGLNYTFSANAFSVLPTSGYSTNIAVALANQDNSCTQVYAPAGFSFPFGGVNYTGFFLSTNGWLALTNAAAGSAAPAPYSTGISVNQLANNTGGLPVIAPLWDDHSVSGMQFVYTAPTLTIRWFNVKWDRTNGVTTSFGVKLNTATGDILLLHPNLAYTPTLPSASIGIAGTCAGDFYSVYTSTATTATVSTTAENTTIGQGTPNNIRPQNVEFLFTPAAPVNDNCSGASNLGTVAATCTPFLSATSNATASAYGNICSTSDNNDVWFQITKPASISSVNISTAAAICNSLPGTSVEVFSGTCASLSSLACATTNIANTNSFGEVNISRPCVSEVLYIRVTGDGNTSGKFQICVEQGTPSGGVDCGNPTSICGMPYSETGLSTLNFGNQYDSANSVCHDPFMNGQDYVFSYTPAVSICISVNVTSAGPNPGLFVFDGCPNLLASTHCIASSASSGTSLSIPSISLLAGVTYYFIVDNNSLNTVDNIPFDISFAQVGTTQPNDPCASATALGTIGNNQSCIFTTYATSCSTPSPTAGYPVPSCGNFFNGVTGDVWLKFTAGFSGNLLIRTQPSSSSSTTDAGMAVYTGTCGSLSLYACDDNSAGSSMPLLSIPVILGQNYFIRVWTVAPGAEGNFDFCISSACAPPNDIPCNAVFITNGGTATGFNTCAGSSNEPLNSAQCVAGGTINTVWYKCVVGPTGTVKIRTHPLTLTDTQIQAFTFPTGCANAVSSNVNKGCNDDGPDCGNQGGQSWHDYSELILTGQIPGDTIYIAVDGYNSMTGTFEVNVMDTAAYQPVYLQDCALPYEVCGSTTLSYPDPGPLNFGNICDFSPTYDCWANGERNSIWYRVTVNPGTFQFAVNSVTDYDFIMWNITGVANPCAMIQAHTLPSIRCNWVTTTGQTGISIPDPNGNWEPAITVSGSPQTFLILIDNWNPPSYTFGYTLDWMGSPIASSPSSVTWTGAVNNSFGTQNNWGTPPCNALPSCAVDAIVSSSANSPVISANSQVNDITINSGATLTINSGVILDVCGNFSNYGTLNAMAGSTVRFIGQGVQLVSGNLTGTNGFANLTVQKLLGSVQLAANIDVKENFLTSNNSSVFNINGKYMKVGGNFTNFQGTSTFTGFASSTVEFNGTGNQFFTNNNASITLNRVKMNKTGGKLYLTGANSIMNIDSLLTLTSGVIVTRSIASLEVNMRNNSTTAITGHNTTSYIDGKLRRKIYAGAPLAMPYSLDFPVGDSTQNPIPAQGYELANITFTTSTLIPDLLAWFMPWPSQPPPAGPVASECVYASYDLYPLLNHGYWTFQRTASTFNGNYNVNLHNYGYNNLGTSSGWTVVKADINANPMLQASWTLLGQCVITSTPTFTQRTGLNPAPVVSANSFNHLYTTAQTEDPLPIELLYFTAAPDGEEVICKWATSSEINNEYYEVERSSEGTEFISLGRVTGYGAGTTTELHKYSFTDRDECKDVRYYRLRQVDIDGSAQYSSTVAVDCKRNSTIINVFPNPVLSDLIFSFYEGSEEQISVQVLDIIGNIVKEEVHMAKKGFNTIKSEITELSKGVYYLRLTFNNHLSGQPDRQVKFIKN
jgi:hypothetical protein